ncbi:MAG: OmpA family protein [Rhodospirillales bacterium]|jgi:flagellar motor protein MotB|nr:OmpA family protein [Rhodospirillales bacterium]MDP6773725.1 OmpA family protein [Rhodospirillales bacterium]
MLKDVFERPPPRPKLRFPAVITVFAASTLLGACVQVPDALNPVEWYKGTVDYFTGGQDELYDDKDTAQRDQQGRLRADRDTPPPGADKEIPNLSTVPARPSTSTRQERQRVVEGLVADRDQARYSSEVIQRQGEPLQPLRRDRAARAARAPAPPVIASAPAASAPPQAPAPRRSAAPPLPPTVVIEGTGAVAGSAPTTVEEIYRARLAQGVPSAAGGAPPANAVFASSGGGYESIVVSSQGVEPLSGTAAQSMSALAAPPRPTMAPVMPVSSGLSMERGFMVATILFANGSSDLDSNDRRVLRDVVAVHRQRGGKLRVIGHASARTRSMDPVRHKMVNFNISVARADAVARELVRRGARKGDISVAARSDTQPIFYEVMPSGEAGNRRAEVFIVR